MGFRHWLLLNHAVSLLRTLWIHLLQLLHLYLECRCSAIFKMNNELEYDRVVEWQENNIVYLIHLKVTPTELDLQIEEKLTGEMWHGVFSNENIQQLTERARGPKKFVVFARMLISSLTGNSESVKAEVLSYLQLQKKIQANNPGKRPQPSTEQLSKKFIILTYMNEFDKMQYPIPLKYEENITKLKFSIKRLAQQLQLVGDEKGQATYARELTLLRQENQFLKNKIKNIQLNPHQDVDSNKNYIDQLQNAFKQQQEKNIISSNLLEQNKIKINQYQKIIQAQKLHILQLSSQDNSKIFQNKLQQISKEMKELTKELQQTKESQKKAKLKINHLEHQLEALISNKKNKKREISPDSDKKSEKSVESNKSIKSNRSNKSNKSLKSNGSNGQKKITLQDRLRRQNPTQNNKNSYNATNYSAKRKNSVYDSDTQSSRLRKMNNGRSSPYRQFTKTSGIHKSRSKSKQIAKESPQNQPKPMQDLRHFSDDSDSDQQTMRKNIALAKLYQKRQRTQQIMHHKQQKVTNAVENKIKSIQQMIRNVKNAHKVQK